jgi:uncharacterized protein (DUF305 family)
MRRVGVTAVALAALALTGCSDSSTQLDPEVRHLQAGAPGEPNTVITEVPETVDLRSPFNDVDVAFLEDMKVHHQQALRMTDLVADRAGREDLVLFTERMKISQEGEIEQIEGWLAEHAAAVERTGGSHSGHSGHSGDGDHSDMPGMLTEQELAAMEAASGEEFVRLFLVGMTRHHEGAIQMVADLLATDGAAADARLYRFATDVDSDQRIEIDRMQRMWATLPQG